MDREKVIEALEHCRQLDFEMKKPTQDAIDNALILLKEQETVKPKNIKGYYPPMYTLYEYEYEKCESPMMNKQPFCLGCGRKVKWE